MLRVPAELWDGQALDIPTNRPRIFFLRVQRNFGHGSFGPDFSAWIIRPWIFRPFCSKLWKVLFLQNYRFREPHKGQVNIFWKDKLSQVRIGLFLSNGRKILAEKSGPKNPWPKNRWPKNHRIFLRSIVANFQLYTDSAKTNERLKASKRVERRNGTRQIRQGN